MSTSSDFHAYLNYEDRQSRLSLHIWTPKFYHNLATHPSDNSVSHTPCLQRENMLESLTGTSGPSDK